MCNVTFIGAGKLAEHVIKGFFHAGGSADSLVVYGRTNDSLKRVSKLGVRTITDLASHLDNHLLIFCVQPKHVGQLAHDLKVAKQKFKAKHNRYPRLQVLSLISGQSINQISENFKIDPGRIVVATMDTSVAICHTIIPYMVHGNNSALTSDAIELINKLGTPRQVRSYSRVLRGVTVYGAGKALDLTVLKLIYLESSAHSARAFVEELILHFEQNNVSKTGFLGWHIDDLGGKANDLLKKYLHKKTAAIESVFGKNKETFFETLISFENTLQMLKAEPNLTEDTFTLQIKNIATEGGCTEKGLGLIILPKHFTADDFSRKERKVIGENEDIKENYLREFFSRVHHRAARFKNDATSSFATIVHSETATVMGALAKGEYPLS